MNTRTRKKIVLVADDHKRTADTLVLILNQNGWDATAAYSGDEAVRVAAALNPDVLISDVVMKPMNGIEAAILIGLAHPDCEIVLVSGEHETTELVENARRGGHAFQVLTKPVHPETFLAFLRGEATHRELA